MPAPFENEPYAIEQDSAHAGLASVSHQVRDTVPTRSNRTRA